MLKITFKPLGYPLTKDVLGASPAGVFSCQRFEQEVDPKISQSDNEVGLIIGLHRGL
jgi:hypothetical protein